MQARAIVKRTEKCLWQCKSGENRIKTKIAAIQNNAHAQQRMRNAIDKRQPAALALNAYIFYISVCVCVCAMQLSVRKHSTAFIYFNCYCFAHSRNG